MDQLEMPTKELEIDIKKEEEEIKIKSQEEEGAKTESSSIIKQITQENSAELCLKRKVKHELLTDSTGLESASKKSRQDIQNNGESTLTKTAVQNNSPNSVNTGNNVGNSQNCMEISQDDTENTQAITTDLAEEIEREARETPIELEEIYSLIVYNFPQSWSFPQICNYVTQSLEGISVEMEPILERSKNELRLTFTSAEHRLSAKNALQDKEVDENKLQVTIEGTLSLENDSVSTEEIPSVMQDIWEADPKGLYGLKPEYLGTLKITPPIGNWVHVTNFRCDKAELRDAFELAGNVVALSIVNTKDKYAKVMYSHPLEAVQAVSMLHDQVYYGMKLNVTMDMTLDTKIMLPKGLLSIGPGLGEDGNPVREITREFERFLTGKSTRINQSLFTAGNIKGIIISHKNNFATLDQVPKDKTDKPTVTTTASQVVSKPTSSPVPVRLNRPDVRTNFPNVRQNGPNPNYRFPNQNPMFRGPMHRGPMFGPMGEMCPPRHRGFPPGPGNRMPMPYGPMPGPMAGQMAGPMPGPMAGPMPGPMAGPMPGTPTGPMNPAWRPQPMAPTPQMSKCLDATTLKITNLPPTTSFPSLCGKLSTLAQVTSLEFTTPGCAVVKFASPGDADKCFQNYRTIELS